VPFDEDVSFRTTDGNQVATTRFANDPVNNFQTLIIQASGEIHIENPLLSYFALFNSTDPTVLSYLSTCEISPNNTFFKCQVFDFNFNFTTFDATAGQQFAMAIQASETLLGAGIPVPLQPGELQLSPFYYSVDATGLTQDTTHITVNGIYNVSETYQCLFAFEKANVTHTSPPATPKDIKTLQCEVVKSTLFGKSFKDVQQKVAVSVAGLPFAGQIVNELSVTYNPTVPRNHYMWILIGGGAGLSVIVVVVVMWVINRNKNRQYQQI